MPERHLFTALNTSTDTRGSRKAPRMPNARAKVVTLTRGHVLSPVLHLPTRVLHHGPSANGETVISRMLAQAVWNSASSASTLVISTGTWLSRRRRRTPRSRTSASADLCPCRPDVGECSWHFPWCGGPGPATAPPLGQWKVTERCADVFNR